MAQISFEDASKALSEREGSDLYYSTGAPLVPRFLAS